MKKMEKMKITTTNNKYFWAMGTEIVIEIFTNLNQYLHKPEESLDLAEKIFQQNEKKFSRFNRESELSMINDNLKKETKVSAQMIEILGLCLNYYKITNGYFDPRIIENLEISGYKKDFKSNLVKQTLNRHSVKIEGNLSKDLALDKNKKTVLLTKRIDTTGLVKGYTVDEVTEKLRANGFVDFVVNAGGDIFVSKVGAEISPLNIEGLEKIIFKVSNEGIATSGITRKKWKAEGKMKYHLVNPKNNEHYPTELKTVTVIAQKTVEADAWAKTLFLMGLEKGLEFAEKNSIKALFLRSSGVYKMTNVMTEKLWTA